MPEKDHSEKKQDSLEIKWKKYPHPHSRKTEN